MPASRTIEPVHSQSPVHTSFAIMGAVSVVHLLNDMMQSVIVAIYPLIKEDFQLSFFQIGMISLTFQMTASMLQPVVGLLTDRKPMPWLLPLGMTFTLLGLILLSIVPSYPLLLLTVGMIGIGSSTFHPESSRVARLASGGRYGLAQSVFQIGGNAGQAFGPLVAAVVVLKLGRSRAGWFGIAALISIVILWKVSRWYARHLTLRSQHHGQGTQPRYPARVVRSTVLILLVLMFSKFFYLASISSYYEFYLMDRFSLSAHQAANYLGVFLMAVAAGTMLGGPLGDRIGRRRVIWFSILGCAPFTLALPYVDLTATVVLSIIIGLILASAFPAIIVYAQDMLSHRIGMVSGLFYGFSFGLGGLGAAVLGILADRYSITFVYHVCAFLPLLGLLAIKLPDVRPPKEDEA